jgi:hypothetical protein
LLEIHDSHNETANPPPVLETNPLDHVEKKAYRDHCPAAMDFPIPALTAILS